MQPAPDLAEDAVAVGGLALRIVRPRDSEALLDERAFEHEEFLPYWAELWPSAVALAEVVAGRDLAGVPVLELGCGLGLPSIVAALGGARVLATDWSADAVAFCERNARLNGVELATAVWRWDKAPPPGPWRLILAADVLYERRNAEQLLDLLPRLVAPGGEVLLAEPGRPPAAAFFEGAGADWQVVEEAARVYRLRPRPGARPDAR